MIYRLSKSKKQRKPTKKKSVKKSISKRLVPIKKSVDKQTRQNKECPPSFGGGGGGGGGDCEPCTPCAPPPPPPPTEYEMLIIKYQQRIEDIKLSVIPLKDSKQKCNNDFIEVLNSMTDSRFKPDGIFLDKLKDISMELRDTNDALLTLKQEGKMICEILNSTDAINIDMGRDFNMNLIIEKLIKLNQTIAIPSVTAALTRPSTISAPVVTAPVAAPSVPAVPSPVVDERYAKYDNMKKKLPEGAVRHSMKQNGFTSAEIDAFISGAPIPPSLSSSVADVPAAIDERFVKYDKMRKMLPEGAVRLKMKSEGISAADIDTFFELTTNAPSAASAVIATGTKKQRVYKYQTEEKQIDELIAILKKKEEEEDKKKKEEEKRKKEEEKTNLLEETINTVELSKSFDELGIIDGRNKVDVNDGKQSKDKPLDKYEEQSDVDISINYYNEFNIYKKNA